MKIKSLTIYCSSSDDLEKEYYKIAYKLGEFLGKKKIKVIYGGGNTGLMGIIANSAFENGSKVIGIMPEFLADKEKINYNISQTIVVKNMTTRKKKLYEKGDAFLILPGGSGTIEEVTEIISWKILGIHNKQIIFYNHKNYWKSLFNLYDNCKINKFGKINIQNICKNVNCFEQFKEIITSEKN